MSQIQVHSCCSNKKFYKMVCPNEIITIVCKTCIKDTNVTNRGIITEIDTGKEVNLAKL